MNNIFKKITYILTLSVALFATGCGDDIDDEITSVDTSRLFSPTDVEALVINRTEVQVTWDAVSKAESYTIEIYDEATGASGTPVKQIAGILFSELPYTISGFEGETSYLLRVKAISEAVSESKWTEATFKTGTEQILSPVDIANDLEATWVTLRWIAGATATEIVLTPGDITYTVTAADIAAGAATITGLTPETKYEAILKNGTKTRGTVQFETPLDLDGAIQVFPEDDLAAIVAAANDGDVFALMPGTYNVATLNITKSVSLKGVRPADRPILMGTIIRPAEGAGVNLKDLILDGTGSTGDQTLVYEAGQFGALVIDGCEIKNYTKGAMYVSNATKIASVSITNCLYHDIECNGGDFIDFRNGLAVTFTFKNNTVYNSALARDFFRMDAGGSTNFPGVESIITIENNTFYKVSNGNNRRMLYIRLASHKIYFNKNILSETEGYYTNQAATTITEMNNNNYHNAPNFTGSTQANAKNDTGSTYTSLDPGFANAAGADFTISNPNLISKGTGDPRWIP